MKQCRKCERFDDTVPFPPRGLVCRRCVAARTAAWVASNPERAKQSARESYFKNRESRLARCRAYREDHLEKCRARERDYALRNAAAARERARQWAERNRDKAAAKTREWVRANPDWTAALKAGYKARRRRGTPPWVRAQDFARIYYEARVMSELTETPHHVDHIVPLRGKVVSGLHVPWNLQVIPAVENLKKSNRVHMGTDDPV